MKTALCFTGTARSLEHTHQNLKNNLIDAFDNCDVFLMIADGPHAHKIEKYFDLPNVKKCIIEQETEQDLTTYNFQPGFPPPRSSKQIYIKMLNARRRCGEMLTTYENDNDDRYERVIFSRLDVGYFEKVSRHVENQDLENLYIPDFHNVFGGVIDGYNDRFAVSNRENMRIYFNLVQSIKPFLAQGGLLHGETFLKWHLTNHQINVKLLPVRFTRVRSDGKEIDIRLKNTSTWRGMDT